MSLAALTEGRAAMQPDLQFIINPGALGELGNAFVVGLCFEIGQRF